MNAPIDVTNVSLETERLVLRPWRESDLQDLYRYARVDGVGQMAGWQPHPDLDMSRQVLNMFIEEKKTFALELKQNGKVIGSLGIEARDENLDLPEHLAGRELGYVLSKDYWGRGLMPEAVKAVITYCFKELHYDYLSCAHFVWNAQSRRVIEKCGFAFEKQIEHTTRIGTIEPTYLYLLMNPSKER